MQLLPIKTRKFNPPKDDIYNLLDEFLPIIQEKDIIIITSKIICIHAGCCLPKDKIKSKDDLIKKHAEAYIPREECPDEAVILTIKHNTIIGSAGIDESNANNYLIYFPENIHQITKEIYVYLKKKFNLKELGIIITDSHCLPLRAGTMGISISFYGLEPTKNYIGKEDIFGRKMNMTKFNIIDSLSATGVMFMGEAGEQQPIVIIRDLKQLKFTEKDKYDELIIDRKKDIYYPLLKKFTKKQNS